MQASCHRLQIPTEPIRFVRLAPTRLWLSLLIPDPLYDVVKTSTLIRAMKDLTNDRSGLSIPTFLHHVLSRQFSLDYVPIVTL